MSRLRIFEDNAPATPLLATGDHAEMARELARIGVTSSNGRRRNRWSPARRRKT